MEHITLWGLRGLLIIPTRFYSSESQALEGGGYLILFDQIFGPHGWDFEQKLFWKVQCPTYAGRPHPLGLNIDRYIKSRFIEQSGRIPVLEEVRTMDYESEEWSSQ